MDRERWEQIQTVFHQAADLPSSEQEQFLRFTCGPDQDLLVRVQNMLEEDARQASMLDGGMAKVAHAVIDGPESSPVPFRNFGRYATIRLLGEGGMGFVYLARREDLGSFVAVKVLRDAWLSPSRREHFSSEQRTLAQLNHPYIARLYDADALPDGTPWFAMEYVEGTPLTTYCEFHHCSVGRRLQLFRAVCVAVEYAHEQAVIHRDLKPSNILVKSDGSVRLLDFGIAKQLETLDMPWSRAGSQTLTGLRMMTPAYAAPEQIRGKRVAIQADVYSLGVILFELLAGKLPFDLSNLTPGEATTILAEHDPGRPSIPGRNNPTLSGRTIGKQAWGDLNVLCLTAMHRDPRRRYRTVDALIRDIDHYQNGEPLEARADTLRYRTSKFVRRNHRAVMAASGMVAVVVALILFFTMRVTRARDVALAEAARTMRVQNFMMDLFEGGDKAAGPSDRLRVVTLIQKGVQEAQALSTDPKAQAELYQTLGDIYRKLGKPDEAEPLLGKALEQRKAIFGPGSPEVAETLVAFSKLRAEQARYAEAEQLARQAIAIDKATLLSGHPALARAISQLGMVLEDRGDYAQAIPVLENAVRMQSKPGGVETDLSVSLSELANSHYYLGHYAISDSLNRQVLEIDRRLYGDRHPHVAGDLINLGAIQLDEGHAVEAEKYDRQALDIMRSFYGKDNPETASAMTLLGRALVSQGRDDEASGMLQDALHIEERVYGAVHPRVASTLNELGKIALRQRKLGDAKADFERMASIYRKVYDGQHYYLGVALSNLSSVYARERQYADAERLIREALDVYAKTLPADHMNVGIARIRLGNILLRERRHAEALVETHAGYEILSKQSSPPDHWIQSARRDLVVEYDALNEPQNARVFRGLLAQVTDQPTETAASAGR